MATISFDSMKSGLSKHPLEVEEQKNCWAWLSHVDMENGKTLQTYSYMVPNGVQLSGAGTRRAIYMKSLKAQGFKPGVSDLVIAYPTFDVDFGGDYHGAFGAYIEMKRVPQAYAGPAAIRAALRKEQKEWLELMDSVGYWVAVAYGTDDFKRLVRLYLAGESPRPLDFIPGMGDTTTAQ